VCIFICKIRRAIGLPQRRGGNVLATSWIVDIPPAYLVSVPIPIRLARESGKDGGLLSYLITTNYSYIHKTHFCIRESTKNSQKPDPVHDACLPVMSHSHHPAEKNKGFSLPPNPTVPQDVAERVKNEIGCCPDRLKICPKANRVDHLRSTRGMLEDFHLMLAGRYCTFVGRNSRFWISLCFLC